MVSKVSFTTPGFSNPASLANILYVTLVMSPVLEILTDINQLVTTGWGNSLTESR